MSHQQASGNALGQSKTSGASVKDAGLQQSQSRRQFLASGATGFVLAIAGACKRNEKIDEATVLQSETVLLKNPAYLKTHGQDGSVRIVTHTSSGEEIAYAVDARGEAAFDAAANVREYHEGVKRSVHEILECIIDRFPDDDPKQQEADLVAFLEAAVKSGILITTQQTVWSVFREA